MRASIFPPCRSACRFRRPGDRNRSGLRLSQAEDGFKKLGAAGSDESEQADDLARLDFE